LVCNYAAACWKIPGENAGGKCVALVGNTGGKSVGGNSMTPQELPGEFPPYSRKLHPVGK